MTKREFRKLGKAISSYLYKNYRAIFEKVKSSLDLRRKPTDLYRSLSYYIVNDEILPQLHPDKVRAISQAYIEILEIIFANADDISASIEEL